MHTLWFVLTNLLILGGAFAAVRSARLSGFWDEAIATLTLWVAQIVASLLIAGAAFSSFRWQTALIVNLALTLLLLAASSLFGGRSRRGRYGYGYTDEYGEERHSKPERLWTQPWVIVLGAVVLGEILLQAVQAYYLPSSDWDSLFYHLVSIATWMQTGEIGITPYVIWSNVYPHNAELFYSWFGIFFGHDRYIDIGQLPLALIGGLSTAGIARKIGTGRYASWAAGFLFVLTPIVVAQMRTNYVDTAFASMFLLAFYWMLRYLQHSRLVFLLLSGLAGGVCLGMKSSGVAYIGVLGLMLLVNSLVLERAGARFRSGLFHVVSFCAALVLLGGFWYIRTWVVYGNPIYPFDVKVLGHVIFPGQGKSVTELIMLPNTPENMLGKPWWKQLWISWKAEPIPVYYDQRVGGFGVQWLWLMVPATLLFGVYSLIRNRFAFFAFCLPMALVFLLQPASWWSRYTVFIVALGAVALAYIVSNVRFVWFKWAVQLAAVGLVLYSLKLHHQATLDWGTTKLASMLPPQDRTVGNLYMPEYRFVDKLPSGSVIAVRFDRFLYPFFGSDFRNKVVMLSDSPQPQRDTFERLKREGVQYLFTLKDAQIDKWALERPESFRIIQDTERYRLYEVNSKSL